MTTIIHRVGAMALACAGLCAAPSAHAGDVFAFDWGYRWASGQILHDAGVADEDPSASRDVYTGSILGYDLSGLRPSDFTFPKLKGSGGTIVVQHAAAGSGLTDTITFLFGAAVPGDEATFRLVATLDPEFQDTPHALNAPWVAGLSGMVYRDASQEYMVAMSPGYATWHQRVAGPVPEPATWALFGLGLAALGWRARRQ